MATRKPIKRMSINAPKKDSCEPSYFTKYILIPQYKGTQETWPKHEIHVSILMYKDSEDEIFFEKVNKELYRMCPELINRHIICKME